MSEHTLLIVDDEPNVLKSLKRLLMDEDIKILTAESGEEGLKAFDANKIQLVISDYRMPGMNGVEFLRKVKELYPETIRLILSGYADAVAIVEAINEGQVYKFITKPWNDQELLTTIIRTIEQFELQQENKKLYSELEARNQELQQLAKSLEIKVSERTRDLEIRNRALTISQNILNLLPVGVLGVDSDGLVVYMNDALIKYLPIENLDIGGYAHEALDRRCLDLMRKAIEDQKPGIGNISRDENVGMIWTPLPESGGAIGLFGYFDLSRLGESAPTANESLRVTNVR